MHSTTINKTPHEVRLLTQTKSSFIPDKCRLARQRADETTTHPISENFSVNDWSRGLLLRRKTARPVIYRYKSMFVPDKSSLARRQFFFWGGHVPTPRPPLRTPMIIRGRFSKKRKNFSKMLNVLRLQAFVTPQWLQIAGNSLLNDPFTGCLVSIFTVRINSKSFPWNVRSVQERSSVQERYLPKFSATCDVPYCVNQYIGVLHGDRYGRKADWIGKWK